MRTSARLIVFVSHCTSSFDGGGIRGKYRSTVAIGRLVCRQVRHRRFVPCYRLHGSARVGTDSLRQRRRDRQGRHRARSSPAPPSRSSTRKPTSRVRRSTNAEGAYSLINVLPGPYDVKVTLTGIPRRRAAQRAGHHRPDRPRRLHAGGRRGHRDRDGRRRIAAAADRQGRRPHRAEVGTISRSCRSTGSATIQALINLVPGTTPMAFGNAETDTPARSMATNVNGQANTQQLDAHRRRHEHEHLAAEPHMYVSPAETVDTVERVDQQLRRRAGHGRRRGGDGHHQVGHERVQGLGVRGLQQREAERQAVLLRRRAGARQAAGQGEQLRRRRSAVRSSTNKLFFFGSFEGYKRTQSLFTFFSVPDAALRAGDFSKAFNTNGSLQTIYNPFTGDADGTGRAAVREQPDSGEHDQPDRAEDPAAVPAAEHRRASAPAA